MKLLPDHYYLTMFPQQKKQSEPIIVSRTPKSVEKSVLVSKSGPNHAKANPFQSFTDNLKVNSQVVPTSRIQKLVLIKIV